MIRKLCPDKADCSACAVVLSKNPRCRHHHFSFRKPKRRCRRESKFVLQEIASVVRCNAGCWNEEHRAAVDRKSRVNDVAKNA